MVRQESNEPYTVELGLMTDIFEGETVNENRPFRLEYRKSYLISNGQPKEIRIDILACADPVNDGPPMYENSKKPIFYSLIAALTYKKGNVVKLVGLEADLSVVPAVKFPLKRNRFGVPYYEVSFAIEVTFFSAYTKYELIHDNINYGAISAEYV